MPRSSRRPYPPEFREQMVELARTGRTPRDLAREFDCSAPSIRNWIAQAAIDAGQPLERLSSAERTELARLRRENRRLQVERDILAKATAWFAARSEKTFTPSSSS